MENGPVSRRDFFAFLTATFGWSVAQESEGHAPLTEAGSIPPWALFSAFASGRIYHGWFPTVAPKGVQLGRTVMGPGKRNLVLGTRWTESDGTESARVRQVLPSGLYVGSCRNLLERWEDIEREIVTEWGIDPKSGEWAGQRPFRRSLLREHFQGRETCPGLVWVVPFWMRTVNKLVEPLLNPRSFTTSVPLEPGEPFSYGRARSRHRELVIPRRSLKGFRFRIPKGETHEEFVPHVVNRNRETWSRMPYILDNFIMAAVPDDPGVTEEGVNRATQELYREVGGWKLNGAWVVMCAAFLGDARHCNEVVYTHQVIDPIDQAPHGVGRVQVDYDVFWRTSYGRTEALYRLMA